MSVGKLPERVSIAANTGSEKENTLNPTSRGKLLCSTGDRMTAEEFFNQFTKPFASKHGIDAYFVRTVDKDKVELPSIEEWMVREVERAARGERGAKYGSMNVPMFGSRKGRLGQSCTDKWKIAAIKQQARRLGAKLLISTQGIHAGEAARRVKGDYLYDEMHAGQAYSVYQTTKEVPMVDAEGNKVLDEHTGKPRRVTVPIKWMRHYYPLVDLGLNRGQVRAELERLKLPYLITTECDICPHQDLSRWERLSEPRLEYVAELERMFNGEYFFTSKRIPLLDAIRVMKEERAVKIAAGTFKEDEPDFGCGNAICGV